MGIIEKFIEDLKKNGIQMDSSKLGEVLAEVKEVVKTKKDYTKEEMVSHLLEQFTVDVGNVLNDRNLIPGYNVAVQVGNIKAQIMDGYTDYTKEHKISEKSLFDIASCTKMFTQIIAYNLINDGVFEFKTPVQELDSRFTNLGNLTIGDITTFNSEFRTPGRIEDSETKEEAFQKLYNTSVVSTEKYNYNDIGMMILKEVMESVTGLTYEELLDKYIISKLGLKDTFVNIPENRIQDLTATPNNKIGLVNDPKAVVLGGYSGHAGVVANANDLLKVGAAVFNEEKLVPEELLQDVYTRGFYDDRRGIMGNTYVYHEQGINKSFVSGNESKESFRAQGSTRNVFGASKFVLRNGIYVNSNAILLNPASMDLEYAKELEKIINERALANWLKKDPINNTEVNFRVNSFIKDFKVDNTRFKLLDARTMAGLGKTSDPITEMIATLSLKLMFLDTLLKQYETEKDKNIEVNIVNKK